MDGRTHTALCAHLRFVQYCLNFNTRFKGTDESECYERRIPTHPGIKVKPGIFQRLFPVIKGRELANLVFSTEVVPENS